MGIKPSIRSLCVRDTPDFAIKKIAPLFGYKWIQKYNKIHVDGGTDFKEMWNFKLDKNTVLFYSQDKGGSCLDLKIIKQYVYTTSNIKYLCHLHRKKTNVKLFALFKFQNEKQKWNFLIIFQKIVSVSENCFTFNAERLLKLLQKVYFLFKKIYISDGLFSILEF